MKMLPPAVAILNPKQKIVAHKRTLADVVSVFQTDLCIDGETLNHMTEASMNILDLLATAVAADIVPMTGEKTEYLLFMD